MGKLYVYLASRSKQGIKLVTVIDGSNDVLAKVEDVKSLKLPVVWEEQIKKTAHDNRMLYELWVQSANSYQEVHDSLLRRGYSKVPMGASPMLRLEGKAPVADTGSCKVKKTMLRKRKT